MHIVYLKIELISGEYMALEILCPPIALFRSKNLKRDLGSAVAMTKKTTKETQPNYSPFSLWLRNYRLPLEGSGCQNEVLADKIPPNTQASFQNDCIVKERQTTTNK